MQDGSVFVHTTCPTVHKMVNGDRFLRGTVTWMDHEADYSQLSRGKSKEHYCHSPMYVFMLFLNTMKINVKMHCIKTIIMAAL
jgi:hypothetical protein